MTSEVVADLEDVAICDSCATEYYSDSEEKGGILFGSYAYCPLCVPRMMETIKQYNEESHIKAKCPANMTYFDWVMKLRNGNHKIIVHSFD